MYLKILQNSLLGCISSSLKDDFVKKSLPLSTNRKLSILLNFPFPSVSFSGVFFNLKMRNSGLVLKPPPLSCLTFISLLRIFV